MRLFRHTCCLLVITTITTYASHAATAPTTDSAFIEAQCRLIEQVRWSEKPFSILFAMVAQTFIGKPYAAGTLDSSVVERCRFTSSAYDCVTFTESALALARCAKRHACSYQQFLAELERIRYRGGTCTGYTSRLHYTSDWIKDNQAKGIVADITQQLGGRAVRKTINFMSTHAELYPQLRDSSALIPAIAAIEKKLSRQLLVILPRAKFTAAAAAIQSGDIIAFATPKDGLDYAHLGIALRSGGTLGFIHASSKSGKVTFEPSLEDYLRSQASVSGITVLRPLDPVSPPQKTRKR